MAATKAVLRLLTDAIMSSFGGRLWQYGDCPLSKQGDFAMPILCSMAVAMFLAMLVLPAIAEEQIEFVLPSGNIGCIHTPKGGVAHYQPAGGGPELLCDRVEPKYIRIILGAVGPARLLGNVGDASCCSAKPVLAYGKTWSEGPFICTASAKGLRCARGKNGFFLSRSRLKVY
jgi:hypothetical protein